MQWSFLSYNYENNAVTDKLNLLFDNCSFRINRSFQGFLVINFFKNTNRVQYGLASYYNLAEGAFQWQTITKNFTDEKRWENVERKQVHNP